MLQNYIFKLVRERDLTEWVEIAPTVEYALALHSKELGMKLECCEAPSGYWIERRVGGFFGEAPEIVNIRRCN